MLKGPLLMIDDRKQLFVWLLRLMALIEFLAFIAVIMPRSWMEAAHLALGLGRMPEGSVLMFMIRQASYAYGMHGVGLWILASDVKRFRPLVLLNGFSFALAGPLFLIIDYTTGMPWWWTAGDGLFVGLFGVVVLWLSRKEFD